jgi:MoxR-like ATPase
MTPAQLKRYLATLLQKNLKTSTMVWGPPGIGKSSIVQQLAQENDFDFVDLRLSQLAPTDLRGLPVAEAGLSKWYPPEFLPQEGRGILFLDELNMAPPALQGVAQQLILDRQIGSYRLPEGLSGQRVTAKKTELRCLICPRRWRIASCIYRSNPISRVLKPMP